MAPIAAELGLPFTFEEVTEAATSRELDDAELEAVAGGDSFCSYKVLSRGTDRQSLKWQLLLLYSLWLLTEAP